MRRFMMSDVTLASFSLSCSLSFALSCASLICSADKTVIRVTFSVWISWCYSFFPFLSISMCVFFCCFCFVRSVVVSFVGTFTFSAPSVENDWYRTSCTHKMWPLRFLIRLASFVVSPKYVRIVSACTALCAFMWRWCLSTACDI